MKQPATKIARKTVQNIRNRNTELISSLEKVQRELAESIGFLEHENKSAILGLLCECWELKSR